jgi:D-xylose 1-dehydrogenase (NADP+, D-xylono-1,5-lactone-forming)
VASRDQRRAEEYAREWEIERAYGSYDALLQDADVEAVYISLPNKLHCEWSIRAVEAGKHVDEGAIGDVRLVRSCLSYSVYDADNIRLRTDVEGGSLMDVGCYCVSGSRLLTGEPERPAVAPRG